MPTAAPAPTSSSAETGYRFNIYVPAQASLTPFARLQVQSVTQNAFSETGASSLSLNIGQQGTSSLRSTIGAESKLALALRLGWLHEYDDTPRPCRSICATMARSATAPTITPSISDCGSPGKTCFSGCARYAAIDVLGDATTSYHCFRSRCCTRREKAMPLAVSKDVQDELLAIRADLETAMLKFIQEKQYGAAERMLVIVDRSLHNLIRDAAIVITSAPGKSPGGDSGSGAGDGREAYLFPVD